MHACNLDTAESPGNIVHTHEFGDRWGICFVYLGVRPQCFLCATSKRARATLATKNGTKSDLRDVKLVSAPSTDTGHKALCPVSASDDDHIFDSIACTIASAKPLALNSTRDG